VSRIIRFLRRLWHQHETPPTTMIELTEDEKRFLSTRQRILLRRNPEKLRQERRELEAMTEEELEAYLAPIGEAPPAGDWRAPRC